MTILKILDTLQQLELRAAELYRWLAEVLAADRQASGVFFRLSLQEQTHANLIAFQRRVILHGGGPVAVPEIDLRGVAEVIAAVDEFRATHPSPTVEEAVAFAMWLEEGAAEQVHSRLLRACDSPLATLVRNLAADDRRHKELLGTLTARFAKESAAC